MENDRFSVAVNRDTKVLLDALVLLKGRPIEQVLHEAVLKMFGAVPESMPRNGGAETPTLSTPDASQTYRAGATLADRIREFVLHEYVEPARKNGDRSIEIAVREVHRKMGLEQRHPAIIGALQSKAFLETGRMKLSSTQGPRQSSTKVLRFDLL